MSAKNQEIEDLNQKLTERLVATDETSTQTMATSAPSPSSPTLPDPHQQLTITEPEDTEAFTATNHPASDQVMTDEATAIETDNTGELSEVSGAVSTPLSQLHPKNMEDVFSNAKAFGIPPEYVYLGYTLRGSPERPINSYRRFHGTLLADEPFIKKTLKEMVRTWRSENLHLRTSSLREEIESVYRQATALENFLSSDGLRQWMLLSHSELVQKIKQLDENNDAHHFSSQEQSAIQKWRKMNDERGESDFSPMQWYLQLAEDTHKYPDDKLVQLKGFWADFSWMWALKKSQKDFSEHPDGFNWRRLYQPN